MEYHWLIKPPTDSDSTTYNNQQETDTLIEVFLPQTHMHIILANISSQTEKPWHKITIDKYMNAFTNHFLNTKEYVTRIPKKKQSDLDCLGKRNCFYKKKYEPFFAFRQYMGSRREAYTFKNIMKKVNNSDFNSL